MALVLEYVHGDGCTFSVTTYRPLLSEDKGLFLTAFELSFREAFGDVESDGFSVDDQFFPFSDFFDIYPRRGRDDPAVLDHHAEILMASITVLEFQEWLAQDLLVNRAP